MAQIDKTFPTLDCAACILTPKMVEAAQNEKITIHSFSEVADVKGFVGNFTVTIKKKLVLLMKQNVRAADFAPRNAQ